MARLKMLWDAYEASALCSQNLAWKKELPESVLRAKHKPVSMKHFHASTWTQFYYTMRRNIQNEFRRVLDVKARFVNAIVMGLILGIIYYGQVRVRFVGWLNGGRNRWGLVVSRAITHNHASPKHRRTRSSRPRTSWGSFSSSSCSRPWSPCSASSRCDPAPCASCVRCAPNTNDNLPNPTDPPCAGVPLGGEGVHAREPLGCQPVRTASRSYDNRHPDALHINELLPTHIAGCRRTSWRARSRSCPTPSSTPPSSRPSSTAWPTSRSVLHTHLASPPTTYPYLPNQPDQIDHTQPNADRFYFYLVVVILIANCATSVGYMISSMTSHEAVAYALGKQQHAHPHTNRFGFVCTS